MVLFAGSAAGFQGGEPDRTPTAARRASSTPSRAGSPTSRPRYGVRRSTWVCPGPVDTRLDAVRDRASERGPALRPHRGDAHRAAPDAGGDGQRLRLPRLRRGGARSRARSGPRTDGGATIVQGRPRRPGRPLLQKHRPRACSRSLTATTARRARLWSTDYEPPILLVPAGSSWAPPWSASPPSRSARSPAQTGSHAGDVMRTERAAHRPAPAAQHSGGTELPPALPCRKSAAPRAETASRRPPTGRPRPSTRRAWGGGPAPLRHLALLRQRPQRAPPRALPPRPAPRRLRALSTKVGRVFTRDDRAAAGGPVLQGPGTVHLPLRLQRRRRARRSIEDSLNRLGVSRIDMVYIHDVSPDNTDLPKPWEEVFDDAARGCMPELARMKEEGLIGGWGFGINRPDAAVRAAERDVPTPDTVPCSPASTRSPTTTSRSTRRFRRSRAKNIAVVVGTPLNAGFLCGRDRFQLRAGDPAGHAGQAPPTGRRMPAARRRPAHGRAPVCRGPQRSSPP